MAVRRWYLSVLAAAFLLIASSAACSTPPSDGGTSTSAGPSGTGTTEQPTNLPEEMHPYLVADVVHDAPISLAQGPEADGESYPGWSAVRSPQEDATAWLSIEDNALVIAHDAGGRRTWSGTGQHLLVHAPAWSPDGTAIAVLDASRGGVDVVLIDPSTAELVARIPLPGLVEHSPVFQAGIDALTWSPDGRQILASWERAVVVDAESKEVVDVPGDQVIATWLPEGTLLYFAVEPERVNGVELPAYSIESWYLNTRHLEGLYSWDLRGAPVLVASSQDLSRQGITSGLYQPGSLDVSPDGSMLSMLSSGHLRVFDLAADGTFDLATPTQEWSRTDLLDIDVAWAPDGSAIADLFVDGVRDDIDSIGSTQGVLPMGTELLQLGEREPTHVVRLTLNAAPDELGWLSLFDLLSWET